MNQLAGVLSDLGLVRWPDRGIGPRWFRLRKSELERLKKEETYRSVTDLTDVRKHWFEEQGLTPPRPRASTATGRSATTGCSPRPSGRWRSRAGASRPATTSRSSAWWMRKG